MGIWGFATPHPPGWIYPKEDLGTLAVHDSKAALVFLRERFTQLKGTLDRRGVREMRMDGTFFGEDVIDLLEAEGVEYAIKVLFYAWLDLKERFVG